MIGICKYIWVAPAMIALATGLSHAQEKPPIEVEVDASQAVDLTDWLNKAAELIKAQHPKIAERLASEGFEPPRKIRLVADPNLKNPGVATGNLIRVSVEWVRKHPDDWGMVVHELVHVIQRYPRGPGWVTEGIADHYRYYVYEPGSPRARFSVSKAHYKQGYQPTAAFFQWITMNHDREFVSNLNAAMRAGKYSDDLFKQRTQKTVDELWTDFMAFVKERMKQQRQK